MRIPDFISGLLIFALAVGALIMALNFPQAIGQTLGPGTFPVVISSVLAVGGLLLVVGCGFLVGFGTSYAGGCTSGHGISGIADLQPASFVALLGFFAGGIVGTFVLLPLILR